MQFVKKNCSCGTAGLSEGEFVSLGWQESFDVKSVVRHLYNHPGVSQVALWGRSMGAVSALLCQWPTEGSTKEKPTAVAKASDMGKAALRRASGGFAALAASARAAAAAAGGSENSSSDKTGVGSTAAGKAAVGAEGLVKTTRTTSSSVSNLNPGDPSTIVAMVLDSPFASFAQLAVGKHTHLSRRCTY